MNTKRYVLAVVGMALIGASTFGVMTALGDQAPADDPAVETPADEPVGEVPAESGDPDPTAELEQKARAVLGMNQEDLASDVRIGRIGDEHMMLTEDHVIGRLTVGLDDLDGSGLRVTDVTVEVPGGEATFTLQAG